MRNWNERPIEVRNLFNPAFCGVVLYRSLHAHQEIAGQGMPFSLSLLILPLTLHLQTRNVLQQGSRGYFLKVLSEHAELQVGLAKRCADMFPFTMEALAVLTKLGNLKVQENGRLVVLPDNVRRTVAGTDETKACQRVAIYLGKEFAKIGHSSTVYATLGIRP